MSSPHSKSCDACGETFPLSNPHDSIPDFGWVLPFDQFGYYAGFTDNASVLLGSEESRYWWMCHDCVVKFLEMFPRLAEQVGPGCHPCERDAQPCCRHAWRGTEIFGRYVDGEPAPGVHTQIAWPDGAWHDDR